MRLYLIIVFVVFTVSTAFSQTSRIHLSSKDAAWPSKFKQAIKANSQAKNGSDTLFITFAEGRYQLHETIHFGTEEKGNKTRPIVIRGDKNVVVSGGVKLSNSKFKPISDPKMLARVISQEAAPHILVYDLTKNGITDLGAMQSVGFRREAEITAPAQLFYNGDRMTLARYPNSVDPALLKKRTSVITVKKVINPGLKPVSLPVADDPKVLLTDKRGEFEYSDNRVSKWVNAKDVWLDGVFSRDWSWSFNKIHKLDTAKRSITLEYNEKYELNTSHTFFFACNLLEEMDVAGEYYIDREEGKLYFYPPKDFNKQRSTIQLSGYGGDLINIKNANNIQFENISFELGRKNAVTINQSENITFNRCEFKNFGITAIAIKGSNNTISNCAIHAIGSTAIDLSGGNVDSLIKANNTVINCEIYDWAYYNRVYTPAVALSGVGQNVINNDIHHAPHGAITISGNDHLIEGNEIYNISLEFKDFGAIYAFLGQNQLMRGHIIRANYFHDIGQFGDTVFAIYADEGTAGWLIEDNVFYKIGKKDGTVAAVFANTGSYLTVKHNLFLDCVETFRQSLHFASWGKKRYDEFFRKSWLENYGADGSKISAIYLKHYPELKNLMTEDRVYVNSNSFTDNTIGNYTIPLNQKGYFKAVSNSPNSENLITASNNSYTKDETLPQFLDVWNTIKNKKDLKKGAPAMLRQYGYFKK